MWKVEINALNYFNYPGLLIRGFFILLFYKYIIKIVYSGCKTKKKKLSAK